MAKKDKAKQAEKKQRIAQKQSKKAGKGEQSKAKKARRIAADDSDADETDLDAVLAEYARAQEKFLAVSESACEPPTSRSSATILASPSNSHELLLFGGESFTGGLASFYNDLFVYNINRDEWRIITSPNSPLPRSGHAWCRGGNAGGVYLFGGEFSSPKQGTFYHYNDFWRLDPASREWTKIEGKGKGPPARSGHRMTYFKNYIILFGGFQDTSQQTKYLQDVWLYDCQNYLWHSPPLPPASQKPDARSSFSFLPHESGAVLYGGYSRVKAAISSGKQGKGGAGSQMTLKPMIHQDTWFLRVTQPPPDAASNTPPTIRWEKRKRPTNPPNPPRAGATMAHHKGRGVLFGGVHDVEESEEGIDSEFFNMLFVWNIERNRFFPLTLRRPRASQKKAPAGAERNRRGRGKADEEELLRNLAAIEMKTSLEGASDMEIVRHAESEEEEEPERPDKVVAWEMPHPRFNAQLTVQDDVLYIFGGTFEKGDREYNFDELLAIDLGKLDGVRELFKREMADWQGSEDGESEEDDDMEEDDEDEDEDEDDMEVVTKEEAAESRPPDSDAWVEVHKDGMVLDASDEASLPAGTAENDSPLNDSLPHPRAFETLREFFARTATQWQEELMQDRQRKGHKIDEMSVKEIRKMAFDKAEEKWWDCREEIRALEDEQEAAGIGEVVNLGDRVQEFSGGAGRRR